MDHLENLKVEEPRSHVNIVQFRASAVPEELSGTRGAHRIYSWS